MAFHVNPHPYIQEKWDTYCSVLIFNKSLCKKHIRKGNKDIGKYKLLPYPC